MGKTRRFALLLGLAAALSLDALPVLAQSAEEEADESGAQEDSEEAATSAGLRKDETPEGRAARKEKRRARLEKGAKRLRDRAAELRQKAASGEVEPTPANGKRPRRTPAEQAERLEQQANKMEQRAKNLDSRDEARSERAPSSARQRRHQMRRSQLNKRWGATLRNPEAIEELKLHAERNAKLKRIRTLAFEKSKDDPLVKRASALMTKEETRHERNMKRIQASTPNTPATETTAGEEAK
jgi:hypothetical protein